MRARHRTARFLKAIATPNCSGKDVCTTRCGAIKLASAKRWLGRGRSPRARHRGVRAKVAGGDLPEVDMVYGNLPDVMYLSFLTSQSYSQRPQVESRQALLRPQSGRLEHSFALCRLPDTQPLRPGCYL
jgi:hypothetical protein